MFRSATTIYDFLDLFGLDLTHNRDKHTKKKTQYYLHFPRVGTLNHLKYIGIIEKKG